MKISIYKNAKSPVPVGEMDFISYLYAIRDGLWQDDIIDYHTGKIEKTQLKAVTPSGIFNDTRANKNLKAHSGFINIDIDQKDNQQKLTDIRETLFADPYIYAGHLSASGKGISIYIRINPEKHYESFIALERYFADKYQIVIDTACKDVSRLRFISYDPELHINEKAKKWTETAKKEEVRELNTNYTFVQDDIDFILDQVKAANIDLAPTYHDWLRLGFALADKYGEGGRQNYHFLSQFNAKYNREQTDKQYTNCVKHNGRGITMNFFFYLAKQAGLKIVTPRTKKIEQVAKLRKKQVGKSGGFKSDIEAKADAMEYLQKMNGIDIEISKPIIDAAFQNSEKGENDSTEEKLEQVFAYIDGLGIRYNEVTQRAEYNGKDMTDIALNSIYINALSIFGEKLSKQLVVDYIYSDRTSRYNPFLEFFNKYGNRKTSGENVKNLIKSINGTMRNCDGIPADDYNEYFIEKWLLSVVASAHGTYSLLILVLSGKQISGKTKWLRGLLPSELSRYYAESKLDEGKDDQINMCTHLIICDDEYGGKSKQEAKKLKDLSSKQTFTIRRPYGRTSEDLNRYAVLCGTSNETDVINDITGNRRVIPVNCESVNFELYDSVDKVDLWAELYQKWKQIGDGWMLTAADIKILNDFNIEYTEASTEIELIYANFMPPDYKSQEKYTSTEIRQYLETKSGIKNISQRRLGIELKKMGYQKQNFRSGNSVFAAWAISKKQFFSENTPF